MAKLLLDPKEHNLPVTYGILNFINRNALQNEKPYTISNPLSLDQEHLRTNIRTIGHSVGFRDLRGFEHLLSVEKNGFEIVKFPVSVSLDNLAREGNSLENYLKECADWTKRRFNAKYCFCYAFKVFYDSIKLPCYGGSLTPISPSSGIVRHINSHLERLLDLEIPQKNQHQFHILVRYNRAPRCLNHPMLTTARPLENRRL
jgi:hypothetical protein